MRYWMPITLLIAIVQVLTEGLRWQMVPAYVLAALFCLFWLLSIVKHSSRQNNRFIAGLGSGLSVLMLVISIALPILVPIFHFPKPTGPYAIGTLTYHWVDSSRPELFTTDPNDHRELMAQVWYPAKNEPAAARAPYIQDADAVTPALARLTHLPGFLFTHFKYVTTNSVVAASIADDTSRYPVLIYLTGLDGFRAVSTFQIEELVSHGYIVVGLDQPGAVAMVRLPDGRHISGLPKDEIQPLIDQSIEQQPTTPTLHGIALPNGIIPYFAQDVSFTLDQLAGLNRADPNHILTGRLDLGQVGTFGISLGGMLAAEACLKDPRLKACLIMDVWIPADVVTAGLQQPSMFITRDADTMRLERQRSGGWTEKDIALTLSTMRMVYEELPGDGYYIEIPTLFHVNATDLPYWSPVTSQLGITGPINGQRAHAIINAYSLAFFDKHLKGRTATLLAGPAAQYPDVRFETRRP
jgi:predicted dienelactone hydrolase